MLHTISTFSLIDNSCHANKYAQNTHFLTHTNMRRLIHNHSYVWFSRVTEVYEYLTQCKQLVLWSRIKNLWGSVWNLPSPLIHNILSHKNDCVRAVKRFRIVWDAITRLHTLLTTSSHAWEFWWYTCITHSPRGYNQMY